MIQWSRGTGKSTKELQLLYDAYKEETKMAIDKIEKLDERTIDCDTILLGIENCLNNTCWKCPYLNVSRCRYAILEDAHSAIEQMVKKHE